MRLEPDTSSRLRESCQYAMALQRFDEARQMIREAQAQKLDDA